MELCPTLDRRERRGSPLPSTPCLDERDRRRADPLQFHLTTLPLLTAEEVSEQILRAHNAQPRWAKTTWAQRQSFLRSLKAWVLDDMEGIVRVACRDTGKTSEWACSGRGGKGTRWKGGTRAPRVGTPTTCLRPVSPIAGFEMGDADQGWRAVLIYRYVEVDAVFGEILTTLSKIDW